MKMKELRDLKGAKMISKLEQTRIKGGKVIMCNQPCEPMANCCTPEGYCGTIGWDGKCYAY